MPWWYFVVWIGGSIALTAVVEWAYCRACRKMGVEPTDIFG